MVWFVIALGLFCCDCYRQVFRWLQPFRRGGNPGRSTFCEARQRLGIAPLRSWPIRSSVSKVTQLRLAHSTADADHGSGRIRRRCARYPGQRPAFGRPGSSRAPAAFPQARVLALCETGSHVLWRFLIKPQSCGEVTMAHDLLRFLQKDMLLLWDRNFLSYQTVSEVLQRGAHLLARIKSNLIFKPIRCWTMVRLAKIYPRPADREKDRNGILVRIIEYTFDDPGRPGSGEPHRLLTTLLDDNSIRPRP